LAQVRELRAIGSLGARPALLRATGAPGLPMESLRRNQSRPCPRLSSSGGGTVAPTRRTCTAQRTRCQPARAQNSRRRCPVHGCRRLLRILPLHGFRPRSGLWTLFSRRWPNLGRQRQPCRLHPHHPPCWSPACGKTRRPPPSALEHLHYPATFLMQMQREILKTPLAVPAPHLHPGPQPLPPLALHPTPQRTRSLMLHRGSSKAAVLLQSARRRPRLLQVRLQRKTAPLMR